MCKYVTTIHSGWILVPKGIPRISSTYQKCEINRKQIEIRPAWRWLSSSVADGLEMDVPEERMCREESIT
jgi:hypothetical protein